ncbi:MAG: hypothetical protein NZ764_01990 [Marinobacter nauticus]|nr:hypothetical protein [Marinobacter nauticus]
MTTYRLNFPDQIASSAGRISGWDRNAIDTVSGAADIVTSTGGLLFPSLVAEDGQSYGVGLEITSVFGAFNGTVAREPAAAIGIFPPGVFRGCLRTSNGGTGGFKFTGLNPGDAYTLTAQCHQGDAARDTDMTVNGQTLTYGSVSEPEPQPTNLVFTGTVPVNGELPVSVVKAATGGQYYGAIGSLELEVTGPVLTLANDLQPGASFTLNYSNYDAVPVSPVTITDSNNNSITVPVTINDNGDGTGTATGTMPSLPSSGTSQGLLFGNVTVELGT